MKKSITILGMLLCLLFSSNINAQEAYLGDIKLTAITFTQRGWMACEGQLLPISQNQALFSLLGTTYGGDGRTTFGLPDLRGRVPVGYGNGSGLSNYNQSQKGGSETNTITVNQIPSHSHTINAVEDDGDKSVPTGNYLAGTKSLDTEYALTGALNIMNAAMVNNTGGNQAVNNIQPYAVVRYVICVQGIFPSRN